MTTDRLYQKDSYLKSNQATVREIREEGIILDQSVFFPRGGGVMGDEGTLTAADGSVFQIVETLDIDDSVVHALDREGPQPGDSVTVELDWARRHTLMRYHTATHVLTGVMFKDYDVRVTGNQLTPEKGRVDFSFASFDRAVLEEGFEKSNALIDQDLSIQIDFISAADAEARPELFKLETGFTKNLEQLRLVDIVGFDVQADGGCHVASLREIGKMTLTKTENKGKSNRRVYFVLE